MLTKKAIFLVAVTIAALMLGGCKTAGSAIQGVGGVINKGGGALKGL